MSLLRIIVPILSCLWCTILFAQDTRPGLQYPAEVRSFYSWTGQPIVWVSSKPLLQQLATLLREADLQGLVVSDYQPGFLDSITDNKIILTDTQDSILTDARITDLILHYLQDVAYGEGGPPVGYMETQYIADCIDLPHKLYDALMQNGLSALPARVAPPAKAYQHIRLALQDLLYLQKDTSHADNLQARIADKLAAMGVIKLNVLLSVRIQLLQEALHTLRRIRCISGKQCIIVNIPSATLDYYEQDSLLLSTRVIVGKPTTRTSTLYSHVTDIVLYPYWTVPPKIASRELLPLIKRKPSFLEEGGYQVLRGGKIVDPATIDWKQYNSHYFPFTLRQSTGCDNSLGIVKLQFNSPYGIYLHDTPWKVLFLASKRYLSHGCVRVEKIPELARYLLKGDSTRFDAVIQKGDSLNTTPTRLSLLQPVPLLILYSTAWTDVTGAVRFYEDIYRFNP